MDPFQRKGKEIRNAILEKLDQYPYSFRMKDVEKVTNKAFMSLNSHLKEGLKAGYSTSLQTVSTRNLLAFTLFQLSEHSDALEETEAVLKMDDQQDNIVALANKAHILSVVGSFDDAEEVVNELKELQETSSEFEYLLVKAKAELASSYMRFGPLFNKHAVDAFKEVLPQAKEPEVWMWKFGLAVTYRHALGLQYAPYASHRPDSFTHNDALKLLQEVINSRPTLLTEAACRNLKANAYVEMGVLFRLTWDKTQEFQLCSQAQMGPLQACKKALELDDNDASVLWKAGKLHRNYKDLFRSRKLLDKAVKLQPSSAAYHHLGLTYKAMATNAQYGKLKTRRGGKREKRRKRAIEERMKLQKAASGSSTDSLPIRVLSAREIRHRTQVNRIKRAVKSPNNATQFDPQDQNVKLAIDNLKKAVDFSARENSRAVYDLALMYVATKKFDEALKLFTEITYRRHGEVATPPGLLEQITSLDQKGLIYQQMADEEGDERKEITLRKKSKSTFNKALSLAAELYSNIAEIKDIFGEIFLSPSALLKAADASDHSETDKRKIKAHIFILISNHKQSQVLLSEIAGEGKDADYNKLMIEAHARKGEYEEAAALISVLKPTEQFNVMKLFERQGDVDFFFGIYFQAGLKTLMEGPCDAGYFASAFREKVKSPEDQVVNNPSSTPRDESTSPQGAAAAPERSSSQGRPQEVYDIMLLHDEEDDDIEDKATRLETVLKKACGLSVVRRDDNYLAGTRQRTNILNNLEHSRLVVVLPGKEERLDGFEEFVSIAAEGKHVILLTDGVGPESIPLELGTPSRRSMVCPRELFAPDIDFAGPYTKKFIDAISCLFKFLTNTE